MTIDSARNPLRRARLAARLELSDLAERTRISPGMLRYMDEGAFDRLPPGIYARAWVRSVAEALALDPVEVLHELEHALPRTAPLEPEPADPQPRLPPARPDEVSWGSASGPAAAERWRRAGIAALDGAILTAVTLAVWIMTAAAADSDPAALGLAAAAGIAAIALTVSVAYFIVFAGIGGRTPGAALMGSPAESTGRLDLAGIGRRALLAALTEASIAVDFLMAAGADQVVLRTVLRRT